ncbi:DUF1795 domain-containing protein [Serratia sp. L9]|uniref:DUF1795 domain-containing protein n=1 Tax=Serratia sp. L9 TaxID=3423946 RepID=UPI003D67FAA9
MNKITYQMNEGKITLPESWRDDSMHVFAVPDDSGVNLVINRTPVPAGLDSEAYYAETLAQFQSSLPGFKELAREVIVVDGSPAQTLEYCWKSPEGQMHQYVVMQVRQVLLLTFTVTSPKNLAASQRDYFQQIIQSFTAE